MLDKQVCPVCGGEDVQLIGVGEQGRWLCKRCGHSGSDFSKKEVIGGEQKGD